MTMKSYRSMHQGGHRDNANGQQGTSAGSSQPASHPHAAGESEAAHRVQFGANSTHAIRQSFNVAGTGVGAAEQASSSPHHARGFAASIKDEGSAEDLDDPLGRSSNGYGNGEYDENGWRLDREDDIFEMLYGLARMTQAPPPTPVGRNRRDDGDTLTLRVRQTGNNNQQGLQVQGAGSDAQGNAGNQGQGHSVVQSDRQRNALGADGQPIAINNGNSLASSGYINGQGRGSLQDALFVSGASGGVGGGFQQGGALVGHGPFGKLQRGNVLATYGAGHSVDQYTGMQVQQLAQHGIRVRFKGGLNGIALPTMTVDRYKARIKAQGYPELAIDPRQQPATTNPTSGNAMYGLAVNNHKPNLRLSSDAATNALDKQRALATQATANEDALAAIQRAQRHADALGASRGAPFMVHQAGRARPPRGVLARPGRRITVIRSRRWTAQRRARTNRALMAPVVQMLRTSKWQLQRLELKVRALAPQAEAEAIAQTVCETLDPSALLGPLAPQVRSIRTPPASSRPAPPPPAQFNANYMALAERYPVLLSGQASPTRQSKLDKPALGWTARPDSRATTDMGIATRGAAVTARSGMHSPMAHRKQTHNTAGSDVRASTPNVGARSVPQSPLNGKRSSTSPGGVRSSVTGSANTASAALFGAADTFAPLRLDLGTASKQQHDSPMLMGSDGTQLAVRTAWSTSSSAAGHPPSPAPPSQPHAHAPSPRGARMSLPAGGSPASHAHHAAAALVQSHMLLSTQSHGSLGSFPNNEGETVYCLSAVGPAPQHVWSPNMDGPPSPTNLFRHASNASGTAQRNVSPKRREVTAQQQLPYEVLGGNFSGVLPPVLPSMHPPKVRTGQPYMRQGRGSAGGGAEAALAAAPPSGAQALCPPVSPPPPRKPVVVADAPSFSHQLMASDSTIAADVLQSISDGKQPGQLGQGQPISADVLRSLQAGGGTSPGTWTPPRSPLAVRHKGKVSNGGAAAAGGASEDAASLVSQTSGRSFTGAAKMSASALLQQRSSWSSGLTTQQQGHHGPQQASVGGMGIKATALTAAPPLIKKKGSLVRGVAAGPRDT